LAQVFVSVVVDGPNDACCSTVPLHWMMSISFMLTPGPP
jgi:hypothetical protein